MDPLISVIVPVYKVEAYLDQCVQSIVDQTYRNLEIILVDDGSPDKCPEMCDAWSKKDSRIKVIHKANGGLGDARNAGLKIASGDFIGFVDSDDWCEKNMYQSLFETSLRQGASISVCNVFVDWECGWATEETSFSNIEENIGRTETLRRFFGDDLTAWAWNKLYRKELKPYLVYPRQSYEDLPVARELFSKVECIALTGTTLYHYRQRQDSIVNSQVNASQYTLIDELQKNVVVARNFNLEDIALTRLVLSSYNFLKKVCANTSTDIVWCIPALVQNIRHGRKFIDRLGSRKIDKLFMKLVAVGIPCKQLFFCHRILQWFYWKLNFKK